VLIAGYELLRGRPETRASPRRASHAEKQRLLLLLRDGLDTIGALPEAAAEHKFRAWQRLVRRADLAPDELHLLEHMARKMAKPRRRASGCRPHAANGTAAGTGDVERREE
jgi:tRNA C32,U32 (ribose-2'-O)-methylase TrmJ